MFFILFSSEARLGYTLTFLLLPILFYLTGINKIDNFKIYADIIAGNISLDNVFARINCLQMFRKYKLAFFFSVISFLAILFAV